MRTRGFTLIELLVVIAIIGLLSSVVLASLSTARLRARDASLMQEVNQLATMYELEYASTGSYANIGYQEWDASAADCNNFGSASANVTQLREICNAIVRNVQTYGMYNGPNTGISGITNTQYFSIMVYLPGAQKLYCAGSRGGRSTSCNYGDWSCSGCHSNP